MVNRVQVLAIAVVALFAAATADAEVTVRLDRSNVELNESFTLEVSVDTNTDAEPDVSALEADFYVGQRREMSNTTIVNGQIRRSKSWSYSLMARRAGQLQVPSIGVGAERSRPLAITVSEPTYLPPGEADVFITAEVDTSETYVQAQVLYRIKVYRAVATRQPTLREPTFEGAEVLIEPAGDESNYEAILGGKAYGVNERVYALFPQQSGEVQISPARFEARVLRDGRITGRKVFASEAQTITVNPIPAPPAEFPDADWLPARDVVLTEEWSDEPAELTAGEPITRNITVSALGQLETQIPVIEPPDSPNINVYADKPELSRDSDGNGIRGVRQDQYALIGVQPGMVELPELVLPWFNLDTGEWQVARLDGRSISVLPADDSFMVEPEPTVTEPVATGETIVVESPFWRRVAQFLAAAWAVTVFAWWWTSRPTREQRQPEPVPVHKQQAKSLKQARSAAAANDAAGTKAALLAWAAMQWPDNPPRSIGALAARVNEPLATELQKLSANTYGSGSIDFDGDATAKAIRGFSIRKNDSNDADGELLPPLMPRTRA